jgi:hypothetical protein
MLCIAVRILLDKFVFCVLVLQELLDLQELLQATRPCSNLAYLEPSRIPHTTVRVKQNIMNHNISEIWK